MQVTPDQDRAPGDHPEGPPLHRREVVSGRLLLAAIAISELVCFAVFLTVVL